MDQKRRQRTIIVGIFLSVFMMYVPGRMPTDDGKENLLKSLKQRLQTHVLTLKVFWKDETIHFDADGNREGKGSIGSWTAYSSFRVDTIDLKKDHLVLKGHRIFFGFDIPSKQFKQFLSKNTLILYVARDQEDKSNGRLETALERLFLRKNEELTAYLPSYWQTFFKKLSRSETVQLGKGKSDSAPSQLNPVAIAINSADEEVIVSLKDREVLEPIQKKHIQPQYPDIAAEYHQTGVVVLRGIVEKDGTVDKIEIIQPMGFCFDESAIEAVEKWTFQPCIRKGQPARCLVTFEVSFTVE